MVAKLLERALSELCHLCAMAYPFEACGALLGTGDGERSPWQVRRVIAIPNRHDEDKRSYYRIAPDSQLAAEWEAVRAGEQVLGYFHSHPDHPALPSDCDWAQAWPSYLYVICSVAKARTVDIAAFAKVSQGGAFLRVPVVPIGPIDESKLDSNLQSSWESQPCPSRF
jgi:proteasome lid subunit RPN8/RPN11